MTRMKIMHNKAGLLILIILMLTPATSATHPHAWISVRTTVFINAEGQATALRQRWLFDRMYSAFAVQDFDPNRNGRLDPDELRSLAKMNISNLAPYDYFTVIHGPDGKAVALDAPKNIASALDESTPLPAPRKKEIKTQVAKRENGITRLTQEMILKDGEGLPGVRQIYMEFTLPLRTPLDLKGKPGLYRVYDPTYYIDVSHDKDHPVSFVDEKTGAPVSVCRYAVELPKVSQAMIFSAAALDKNAKAPKNLGYYFAEKVTLSCSRPKS